MRGLRLFIRPIEASDNTALAEFLAREHAGTPVPACGLLAKLLGNIVAVASFDVAPDAIRLETVFVSSAFRRKRIGRQLVREMRDVALKMERNLIYVMREDVPATSAADDFLRSVGFVTTEDRWVLATG